MQFSCDICNCSYTTRGNYNTHLKSKKHQKLTSNLFKCESCEKKFHTKYNYDRHFQKIHNTHVEDDNITDNKKTSLVKYEKDLDLLKMVYELKHETELLKKDLVIKDYEKEMYRREKEIHEKDKVFAQDIAKTVVKTTDTAVNGLTYAKKHYTKAPELKKLDKYELGSNDELVESLLFYSRKGTLPAYIGDFIIKFYKKDDPNNQSLWSTDLARLTFIVRQILKDKADWKYDKKGIKVCNIIISPLLDNIKSILKQYNDDINEKITNKPIIPPFESDEIFDSQEEYNNAKKAYEKNYVNEKELDNNQKMQLVDDQQVIVQIITDIDNKTLAKRIIGYISPHLSLTVA